MKVDTRKRTGFMVTNRKGKVILHSPRGSNIMIKPEELAEALALLTAETLK
ncbi:hypothetical protein PONTUS_182 [Vibrio phage Pontus]|uniref:Uncharacterized protein n=1 Tax=Vibrio phage Pontus TaxID=2590874 RepID=A0A4Y6EI47_9CAUD|nr:hypothetical protein KNU59_gp121 [Vibrio phage Pontus]QDF14807.1 hypothetical protein PONTUS_182 [Vibrio phage Pontus]